MMMKNYVVKDLVIVLGPGSQVQITYRGNYVANGSRASLGAMGELLIRTLVEDFDKLDAPYRAPDD